MSRQDANAAFALSSFLQGTNAAYIDDLYARDEQDPHSVDGEWQEFFKSLKDSPADVKKNAQDRMAKSIETLRDYVLVSQDRPRLEHFSRQPDGSWSHAELEGTDAALTLDSINCRASLADIYDRIDFE